MYDPERVRKSFLVIGVAGAVAVVVALWFGYPRLFTGAYAKVTFEKLELRPDGHLHFSYNGESAAGVDCIFVTEVDGVRSHEQGHKSDSSIGAPKTWGQGGLWDLAPEVEIVERTNLDSDRYAKRLKIEPAEYQVESDQPLIVYEFVTPDGKEHRAFFEMRE